MRTLLDFPNRRPLWTLVILTVFGGVLRFVRLSYPCLWGDEALVYWRTCGSFAQLLDCLRTGGGFTPLYYEWQWLLGRVIPMTPAALRMTSAIAGTGMIPATYFFARQLVGRGPSLAAAAVTAGSAFMVFYARDAKMYAETWLAGTLFLGGLLLWLRTGNWTAYLGWVAAGVAMVGLQADTGLLLAPAAVVVLTGRAFRWRQAGLWTLGVGLIAAGPVGFYAYFNQWIDRVADGGASGTEWVAVYNAGRSDGSMLGYFATTFAVGWEWPKQVDVRYIDPGRLRINTALVWLTVSILVPGLLWWPKRWRLKPPPRGGQSEHELDDAPERPWRAWFWLATMILPVVYGFYCFSVRNFQGPVVWLDDLRRQDPTGLCRADWFIAMLGVEVVVAAVLGLIQPATRPATRRVLTGFAVAAGVLAFCLVVDTAARAAFLSGSPDKFRAWHSLWVPRYVGFIWPALATVVGIVLCRWPTRIGRRVAVGAFVLINVVFAMPRLLGTTEPPTDVMARDLFDCNRPGGDVVCAFTDPRGSDSPGDGTLDSDSGRYYLARLAGGPMSPARYKSILREFRIPTARGVPGRPSIRRWVVWDRWWSEHPLPPMTPPPGWHVIGQSVYPITYFWSTTRGPTYRRTEFARDG